MLRRLRAAPAVLGRRTGRHASGKHEVSLPVTSTAGMPATGRDTGPVAISRRFLPARSPHHSCLQPHAGIHQCESSAHRLGAAAAQAGLAGALRCIDPAQRTCIMHTLCTPCALRGHACRLTRFHFCACVSQGACTRRAWRPKVFSRRLSTRKSRSKQLKCSPLRAMGCASCTCAPRSVFA